MRKFILYIFGFAFLFSVYLYLSESNEREVYQSTQPKILTIQPIEKSKALPLLDEINTRNKKINSFLCDDLNVIVNSKDQRRPVRLKGNLAYEKKLKFRFRLDSILGNELDIGSDGQKFWFWSDSMEKPALYWAKYEDLKKTRLKTPFNPYWMAGSFGLDEIDYEDAVVDNSNGVIRVIKETTNTQGKPISLVTTIDPVKKRIISYSIYDINKTLVGSAEIKEFYDVNGIYLPKKMVFEWTKEESSMTVNFNRPTFNGTIDANRWAMPNKKPVIDMTTDSASNSGR
jgi:hypothetical protein